MRGRRIPGLKMVLISHKYILLLRSLRPIDVAVATAITHVQGLRSSAILDKLFKYDFLLATSR